MSPLPRTSFLQSEKSTLQKLVLHTYCCCICCAAVPASYVGWTWDLSLGSATLLAKCAFVSKSSVVA